MNIIYSIIIASLLLFGTVLFPDQADAVVCQNKTAIVYSNGMFNDEGDAFFAKNQLRNKLIQFAPAFSVLAKYEFHLAYASDKDGLGSTFKDQLMEIYYQKQADLLSSFWRWFGGIEASPQWFDDAMVLMAGAQTALTYVSDVDFQKQLNGDGSIDNPGYRKLLNDGKRVLIVSHSQGNFYANAVYDTLSTENVAWVSSLGVTAIATPASHVAGGGSHLTLNEDYIIAPITTALQSTPTWGSSDNMAELTARVWANASYGHNFVQWYLAGTFSRDIILNNIITTIGGVNGVGGLQYPSCQNTYIKASNTTAKDLFGYSSTLSADGKTLAVGAAQEGGSGAVYVYTLVGSTWTQQAYLKGSNTESNPYFNSLLSDYFGVSVSLSADGNTMVVGAVGEASSATGINGNQLDNSVRNAGAVYVFERTGTSWSQKVYIKASNTNYGYMFGYAVDLSADGNTLAVGSNGENTPIGDPLNNSAIGTGATYVFVRIGGIWSQQAYIKASNAEPFDAFGRSVALSGDGNTLAIGANREQSSATGINGNQLDNSVRSAGAVYMFVRTGDIWKQQAYIKASNTASSTFGIFGDSVALSNDGNTLAVGDQWEESAATGINGNQLDNSVRSAGAVYMFVRTGAIWKQQAYIKASNTEAGDYFGSSVSLSGDGNTLAVGGYLEDGSTLGINGNQMDNNALQSGAVYMFARVEGQWSQYAYIKASNTEVYDYFGFSVSLSDDGDTLAVGAMYESSSATGINGDQTNNAAFRSGAVYVY